MMILIMMKMKLVWFYAKMILKTYLVLTIRRAIIIIATEHKKNSSCKRKRI